MQDFRKLQVWEKAHRLTLKVYRATEQFPSHELYGLRSQLRRATASIPTNIAEGCGRGSSADFARFLQIAVGSASEAEYQILLSFDLGYLPQGICDDLTTGVQEAKRMLTALINRVRRDDDTNRQLKTEN